MLGMILTIIGGAISITGGIVRSRENYKKSLEITERVVGEKMDNLTQMIIQKNEERRAKAEENKNN